MFTSLICSNSYVSSQVATYIGSHVTHFFISWYDKSQLQIACSGGEGKDTAKKSEEEGYSASTTKTTEVGVDEKVLEFIEVDGKKVVRDLREGVEISLDCETSQIENNVESL